MVFRGYSYVISSARLLHQGVFTTVYELRRNFMMLAININCCVSSRARGAAWLRRQLSTIRIRVQIVTVFGRIRIVHLTHYSVQFEFESNIRYSPILYPCSVCGSWLLLLRMFECGWYGTRLS